MDKRLANFLSRKTGCEVERIHDESMPVPWYRVRFRDEDGFGRAVRECDRVKRDAVRCPTPEALREEEDASVFGTAGVLGSDRNGDVLLS